MCDLIEKSKAYSKTGWKVVAVDKKGDYYSLAMGYKHSKNGKVPVVKEQKRIDLTFDHNILDKGSDSFSSYMTGRTSIFLRKRDTGILTCRGSLPKGFTMQVKKAIVSDNIMLGKYGGNPVAAGRHIEFLE